MRLFFRAKWPVAPPYAKHPDRWQSAPHAVHLERQSKRGFDSPRKPCLNPAFNQLGRLSVSPTPFAQLPNEVPRGQKRTRHQTHLPGNGQEIL